MSSQTLQPAPKRPGAAGAVGTLLRDLIDYAGLFPPASLAMAPTAPGHVGAGGRVCEFILSSPTA